jgi:hypothetical protein
MDINNFLKNIFQAPTNSSVTVKSGRYTHTFPYAEVKGLTLREAAIKAAEFLHIDANKISSAEVVVPVNLEENVSKTTSYRVEAVSLENEVDENSTYSVDMNYGSKG